MTSAFTFLSLSALICLQLPVFHLFQLSFRLLFSVFYNLQTSSLIFARLFYTSWFIIFLIFFHVLSHFLLNHNFWIGIEFLIFWIFNSPIDFLSSTFTSNSRRVYTFYQYFVNIYILIFVRSQFHYPLFSSFNTLVVRRLFVVFVSLSLSSASYLLFWSHFVYNFLFF